MAKSISASVGKGGKNNPEDVKIVQELLNQFASSAGFSKLKVGEPANGKLSDAIGKVQLNVCGFKPDHKVDPGKRTLKTLNAGPSKAKAEAKRDEAKQEKIKEGAKSDARKQACELAKAQAQKVQKATKTDDKAGGWDGFFADIEAYAEELYETYFAKEAKSGKKAEEVAQKVGDQVCKEIKKKTEEEAKKKQKELEEIDTGEDLKPSRGVIKGPISGVDAKIVNVLNEVSAFYGKPIEVTSGLRSPAKQGQVMWDYWVSNLDRGLIYSKLKKDKELQQKLDGYYNEGKKTEFIALIKKDAASYSRHVWGGAVDIKKSTDKKMLDALETCLRKLTENLCYHFDGRGKTIPSKIPESIKKTWKK